MKSTCKLSVMTYSTTRVQYRRSALYELANQAPKLYITYIMLHKTFSFCDWSIQTMQTKILNPVYGCRIDFRQECDANRTRRMQFFAVESFFKKAIIFLLVLAVATLMVLTLHGNLGTGNRIRPVLTYADS